MQKTTQMFDPHEPVKAICNDGEWYVSVKSYDLAVKEIEGLNQAYRALMEEYEYKILHLKAALDHASERTRQAEYRWQSEIGKRSPSLEDRPKGPITIRTRGNATHWSPHEFHITEVVFSDNSVFDCNTLEWRRRES